MVPGYHMQYSHMVPGYHMQYSHMVPGYHMQYSHMVPGYHMQYSHMVPGYHMQYSHMVPGYHMQYSHMGCSATCVHIFSTSLQSLNEFNTQQCTVLKLVNKINNDVQFTYVFNGKMADSLL